MAASAAEMELGRACGALAGMMMGDALGMPSQTLSPEEIARRYGAITGFVEPFDGHPVSHGMRAGQVTDDTEQAFLLAGRMMRDGGRIDEILWARDLLDWEADVRARGLLDLLGPSTREAIDAVLAGASPLEAGRNGTTNGAAMRIAPVGIATPHSPLPEFVDQVELACRVTHNTREAIAAAAAVACAISCGVEGQEFEAVLDRSLDAARAGRERGYPVGADDMADRIEAALDRAGRGTPVPEFAELTGTSVASRHAVPAAFGIARMAKGSPWKAARIAANIGGDTDTIGAIAGAMVGATCGLDAFESEPLETLLAANDLPVERVARGLLEMRAKRAEEGLARGEAAE